MSVDEHESVEQEALADSTAASRSFTIAEGFKPPQAAPDLGYRPMIDQLTEPPRSRERELTEFRLLEDIYPVFPIGSGAYVLVVERDDPKRFCGVPVGGVLGALHEQLTTEQFHQRYGGGEYTVYVRAFTSKIGQDGQTVQRTRAHCRFRLPGPPRMPTSEQQGQETSMAQHGYNPQVEVKKLELADAQARRHEEAAARTMAEMPRLTQAWEESAARRAQEIRETMHGQIARLESELARKNDELDKARAESNMLRQQMSEMQNRHLMELTAHESKRERELSDRHNVEINRMREERVSAIDQLRRDNDQRIQVLTDQHQAEIRRLTEKSGDERSRTAAQHASDISNLRAQFESQLTQVNRELDRVRSDAASSVQLQLAQQKQVFDAVAETNRTTQATTLESLRNDLNRERSECARLREENDKLRRENHKTPLQGVKEAQTLLEAVGVPVGGRGDDDEEEAPKGWMGIAAKAAEGLVPTILGIMQPRPGMPVQPNPQLQMPPQGMQPGRQLPPHVAAAQPRVMQAPPPRRRPRAPGAPPPGPPAPGEAPHLPPGADAPVAVARPTPIVPLTGQQPVKERAAVPLSGTPFNGVQESARVRQQQAAQPAPAEPAVQEQNQATVVVPTGYEEQINSVLHRLNEVITNGDVPPPAFAQELVGAVGPQTVALVINSYTPEALINDIARTPNGDQSMIVTPLGRRYVAELWHEARKLLAAQ